MDQGLWELVHRGSVKLVPKIQTSLAKLVPKNSKQVKKCKM
jgi:hypothetical protein